MSHEQIIEAGHKAILDDFKKLYVASKPSFRELQAQERTEVIARIKNHLWACLLCKIIKKNSEAGNENLPVNLNFHALLEVICDAEISITLE